ncbi:MAG: TrbI/VirB10 family protein [Verrucomicrobiae bacterium]|nr:TrbI/VirB10 family protein [Verrucomicrobiae bacterium]
MSTGWLQKTFVDSWKTKDGRIIWLIVLITIVAVFYGAYFKLKKGPTLAKQEDKTDKGQEIATTVQTLDTGIPVLEAQPQAPPPPRREEVEVGTSRTPEPPIFLFISSKPTISSRSVSYGTPIECILINTVDSSKLTTPIIGIVLRDVWSDSQELVIPAGALIHGFGQNDRVRDRIGGQNNWILVFKREEDGKEVELPFTGILLDAAPDPDGNGWQITDASAGMRGDVKGYDGSADAQLFFSTFLSAAAQGFRSQQTIFSGGGATTVSSSGGLKDALASAVAASMQQEAQKIAARIQSEAVFVRVAGGKPFYVYITQPLDASQAAVGASLRSKLQGGQQ